MADREENIDLKVVDDFGSEWARFDQKSLTPDEHHKAFSDYFSIFPWGVLCADPVGADIGCGSGRWSVLVAPKVRELHLVEPSPVALSVAESNLSAFSNVIFHNCSVDRLPFEDESLDFAYSLGVLHHIPNTAAAIRSISKVLKPGAPLLLYLYYAFDQRSRWFRMLWKASDVVRKIISKSPRRIKHLLCDTIAILVYWPLARIAWVLEKIGILSESWPLSYYRKLSFYVMRTDALDRFGTRIEHRFTRIEIKEMLEKSGFERVSFSSIQPFWCVVGMKK